MRFSAIFGTLAVGGAMFVVISPAKATPVDNSTGLSSPAETLNFGVNTPSFAQGTEITNQYEASFGVTFGPGPGSPPDSTHPPVASGVFYDAVGPVGPFTDANLTNFLPGNGHGDFQIVFDAPVTGAAVQIGTQTGTTTLTAFLKESGVETQVATVTGATNFGSTPVYLGFTGVTFDTLVFHVSSSDGAALFNNLQVAPEPSCLGLLSLSGLLIRRRRI